MERILNPNSIQTMRKDLRGSRGRPLQQQPSKKIVAPIQAQKPITPPLPPPAPVQKSQPIKINPTPVAPPSSPPPPPPKPPTPPTPPTPKPVQPIAQKPPAPVAQKVSIDTFIAEKEQSLTDTASQAVIQKPIPGPAPLKAMPQPMAQKPKKSGGVIQWLFEPAFSKKEKAQPPIPLQQPKPPMPQKPPVSVTEPRASFEPQPQPANPSRPPTPSHNFTQRPYMDKIPSAEKEKLQETVKTEEVQRKKFMEEVEEWASANTNQQTNE